MLKHIEQELNPGDNFGIKNLNILTICQKSSNRAAKK